MRHAALPALLGLLAAAVLVGLWLQTVSALDHVENAHREKARALTRAIVSATRGVVRYGPDKEGRVAAILEEVVKERGVVSAGIYSADGLVASAGPSPSGVEVAGLPIRETFARLDDRLYVRAPFEIETAWSCKLERACAAIAPGSYAIVLGIDSGHVTTLRGHVILGGISQAVVVVLLLCVTALLNRATRERERLSLRIGAERQKREGFEALGMLAAGLAHEIRNPLGAIRGYTQLLREEATAPKEQEHLDLMLSELDRVGERLEEFLGFARQRQLKREPVDLARLFDETMALLLPDADAKEVKLVCERPPKSVTVQGDAARLKELLLNVLLNAVEACRPGNMVTVRFGILGGATSAVIVDTGPGIATSDLVRIFEPYFTTKPGGSGLGLAISRRIADEHGAALELESQEGKGTTVRITFPTARG